MRRAAVQSTKRSSVRGYALVASAAATWGTWSLYLRPAERLQRIPAALETTILFAGMALACAPLAIADGRRASRRSRRAWGAMALLGATDALNAIFFFLAMQRTTIAVAVLSHYLAPLLTSLVAPVALGERSSRGTWLALALSLAGLALLLEPWRGASGATLAGAAFGAASAVFYTGNMIVNKRLQPHFSPSEIMTWHSIVSMLVVAAVVPSGGWAIAPKPFAILALGALVPGALAGLAFVRGYFEVPASHASVLTLLEPLVAVSIAAVAWGEIPGPIAAVGGALILAGAYLVLRAAGAAPSPRLAATGSSS